MSSTRSTTRYGRVEPDQPTRSHIPNASADLIFANSVFTHMQEREVEHYFSEAARVLRPGGQAWFSFFLFDADSEERNSRTRSTAWSFDHSKRGRARSSTPMSPTTPWRSRKPGCANVWQK
jgi:SAM-dependent methyltransferase